MAELFVGSNMKVPGKNFSGQAFTLAIVVKLPHSFYQQNFIASHSVQNAGRPFCLQR